MLVKYLTKKLKKNEVVDESILSKTQLLYILKKVVNGIGNIAKFSGYMLERVQATIKANLR